MTDDLIITTRPLAFSAPMVSKVAHGATIANLIAGHMGNHLGVLQVEINGRPIAPAMWGDIVPSPGDHVLLFTKLHGDGKSPLRTVLMVLVVIAAAYVAGVVGGMTAFKAGGSMAAWAGVAQGLTYAAVTTAGMLLVNAIAPIRPPALAGRDQQSTSTTYSISGARNVENPFGPVPVLLGRHRIFPPHGARPYTEISGADEYLNILLLWGYGPLKPIGELKIGDTPISAYEGVDIQEFGGWPDDESPSLFPSQVQQDFIGVTLKQTIPAGETDSWVTRTAPTGADDLSLDTYFNRGLVLINNSGGRQLATVEIETEYREVGAASWIPMAGTVNYPVQGLVPQLNWPREITLSIYARPDGTVQYGPGVQNKPGLLRIGQFTIVEDAPAYFPDPNEVWNMVPPTYKVGTVTDIVSSRKTDLVCTRGGDQRVDITPGSVVFENEFYTAKTPSTIRYGMRWSVDRTKQYEVRRRRVTLDTDDNDRLIDECTWTVLRGVKNDSPFNFEHPVACTAIRIKATDQLSGVVDNINQVWESYAPVWNSGSSSWSSAIEGTNNPAALHRWALLGPFCARPRSLDQMAEAQLGEWYELCVTHGYEFNMYRDFRASVWDTCADIAAAGRAAVSLADGVWGSTPDTHDKQISQHITPRNSWGFSAEKVFFDAPHAFRIRFINEEKDYQWDEQIVYDDGYDSSNATLFEGLELPGITKPSLIWKFGRFHIAQAKLRPETYSVYMDFEHLACRRGDLVRVAHDIPLWGGQQGRIKSYGTIADPILDETDGAILDETGSAISGDDLVVSFEQAGGDEKFLMQPDINYAVRFRRSDGTSAVFSVETVPGETSSLTFSTPVPGYEMPQIGDLYMFGEAERESAELLVKHIERSTDYVAKLTLVDYAPPIYTADTGPIPPHESMITAPFDVTMIAPSAPFILSVESGTSALEVMGNVVRPRILVNIQPAIGVRVGRYRVRYRITGEPNWSFSSAESASVYLSDIIEGETYRIQAQAISIWGRRSAWSSVVTETVVGESEPPGNVTGFRVNIVGADAKLSWNALSDRDLSHYKIRWSPEKIGATWAASTAVVDKVGRDSTSVSIAAMVGTYLIKGVDFARNESLVAAAVITNIARISGLNVVDLWYQEHNLWTGAGFEAMPSVLLGGIVIRPNLIEDPNFALGQTHWSGNYTDFGAFGEDGGAGARLNVTNGMFPYLTTRSIYPVDDGDYFYFTTRFFISNDFDATQFYAVLSSLDDQDALIGGTSVQFPIDIKGQWRAYSGIMQMTYVGAVGVKFTSAVISSDGTAGYVLVDYSFLAADIDRSIPIEAGVSYYEFDDFVSLGAVFTSRVSAALKISGQNLFSNLYAMGNLYAAGNLYGAAEGQYDAQLELAITDDIPANADSQWSDWKGFLVGDYTAAGYKFRAALISNAANVTPILKDVEVEIDMPDRVEEWSASVGVGGAAISFSPPFYNIPEIGLSVIDGVEGDAYTITSHSETGFTIAFTNSGSPVARNVMGIAKGYGEKEI